MIRSDGEVIRCHLEQQGDFTPRVAGIGHPSQERVHRCEGQYDDAVSTSCMSTFVRDHRSDLLMPEERERARTNDDAGPNPWKAVSGRPGVVENLDIGHLVDTVTDQVEQTSMLCTMDARARSGDPKSDDDHEADITGQGQAECTADPEPLERMSGHHLMTEAGKTYPQSAAVGQDGHRQAESNCGHSARNSDRLPECHCSPRSTVSPAGSGQ